jgi:shikimate kinase
VSLFLIGPRGAGKTSAGRLAADSLGVAFVDADQRLERRAGRSIAQLVASDGEAAFRALERAVMLELLERDGLMVATGGGCVLDRQVRGQLRQRRVAVWLTAPLDVLQRRIRGSARPSLTGAPIEQELALQLRQRRALYEECAVRQVDTAELSLDKVAHVIQQLWQTLPHHHLR